MSNALRELIKRELPGQTLLLCGGAYGHLSHLYEALDMTFSDLLEVLEMATEGRLENVTEKTDGINMYFSVFDGELRVATNPGFIKSGGMAEQDLRSRYESKPNVLNAYLSAYEVLQDAVNRLQETQRAYYFGSAGMRTWYSVEVISSALSMTIRYDKNVLAIHMNGSKNVLPDGTDSPGDPERATELGKLLSSVAADGDWKVQEPTFVNLPKMDRRAFERARSRIMSLGVSESDTVQDYLFDVAKRDLQANGLRGASLESAARKLAGYPGQPNLTSFKKNVPVNAYSLMQSSKEWAKQAILPLEEIVTDFAVERLRNVESVLVTDGDAEVARLRSAVEKAIARIESSGEEVALDVLRREMIKLKSVDNIVSPMEGIVFRYKDRILKLTGSFSSFHKILALFTFGKGGVVLKNESKRYITEGGNAVSGVGPLPLSAYEENYKELFSMLRSCGATKVVPVGSTGKKDPMGDVDLAVETKLTPDEFRTELIARLDDTEVVKNVTVVSFSYDFSGHRAQVDLMFGNVNYLSWARAGTDPRKTPFKGIVRNLLLNVLAKILSEKIFEVKPSDTEKIRYVIDLDKGLFMNKQTKVGKNGKPLADWKTTEREFITDDPEEIVSIMLGQDYTSKDTLDFESLSKAIANSKLVGKYASEIMASFAKSALDTASKRPDVFGPRTKDVVAKIASSYFG